MNLNFSSIPRGAKKIGVIGFGKMGRQLIKLHEVLNLDSLILVKSIHSIEYRPKKWEHSRFTTDLRDLMNCEVVIEMLPEDLGLKTQLLKDLQTKGYLGLMCTSTSTFTLGDFEAQGLYLNRLSLLHFSNPINAFKIVEVSSANLLDDELLGTREDYLRKLDHIGIEVPDSKGFIINRLFFRYLREALVMHCCEGVDRGVIDKVMIGGIGQKMGPFEIIELIGKRTTKLVLLSLYGEIDQKIVEFLDTDD